MTERERRPPLDGNDLAAGSPEVRSVLRPHQRRNQKHPTMEKESLHHQQPRS
jgi:hypothetical protein